MAVGSVLFPRAKESSGALPRRYRPGCRGRVLRGRGVEGGQGVSARREVSVCPQKSSAVACWVEDWWPLEQAGEGDVGRTYFPFFPAAPC